MNQLTLILLFWPIQSLEQLRLMGECRTPKRLNADILNSDSVNTVTAASMDITPKMICIWCNNKWCSNKCSSNNNNIICNSNKCRLKAHKIHQPQLLFLLAMLLHLQVVLVALPQPLKLQIHTLLKMIQMFNNI